MRRAALWKYPVMGVLVLAGGQAGADNEVQVSGVANLRGASYGECTGASHSVHTATAAAFAEVFNSLKTGGDWDEVLTRNDTAVEGRHWTDISKATDGRDETANWGADETDVLYIHTHGSHNDAGAYVSLTMGDGAYDCGVNSRDDMYWGNLGADLDIAVVKACQAGQYTVWQDGGFWKMVDAGAANTLGMWNSFHGDSSCGSHVTNYVRRYSSDSVFDGVGENWMDEAYSNSLFADSDDCPTSIVFGPSSADRSSFYTYGGWKDRRTGNVKTGSTIHYFNNCDPENGIKLP
jgi:hypothetical protein